MRVTPCNISYAATARKMGSHSATVRKMGVTLCNSQTEILGTDRGIRTF